ncbi:MAG: calcineurin-like phosphoesterase family protein [Planctomycetota bacterium]
MRLLLIGMGACVALTASGQDAATGVVFEDRNSDGVRQASEPGVAGVAVTNGIDVVRTDAEGRYELLVGDDSIVSVVKPAGYQVPMLEQGTPNFYYIHKPEGSPDDGFIFPGVEPTGDLPASIDFPLVRADESEDFSVIVFGDPQPYTMEQIGHFRADVIDPHVVPGGTGREANIHGASLGISLGDLVGDHLDFFEPLNEAQSLLGVPWYNVYGNHDMNFLSGGSSLTEPDPDRYADETFERVYGPTDYAFQYGRAHFIVLDNVIYLGYAGMRDTDLPAWADGQRPVTNNYRGGLRPEQIDFVRNYLAGVPRDDLVVLAFHIPIEGGGVHRIPEQRELFEALSTHPHTLSLSGHTHLQRHWFFGAEEGYTADPIGQHNELHPDRFPGAVHHHLNAVTASGSWYRGAPDEYGRPHAQMSDGAPNGYTLLHIEGNRYSTEFRAARRSDTHAMSISLAAPAGDGSAPSVAPGPVVVNVFNGAEGDRVEMRVVGGRALGESGGVLAGWSPLDFTPMIDPHYAATHGRERSIPDEARGYRVVANPNTAHHLWSGTLPAGLPSGTHVLEIRHEDLYGKVRTDRRSFRVE